jgi:inosine-uridine nucleoside N-ribohydrolase
MLFAAACCLQVQPMRVDIETGSVLSAGQTVCDVWKQSGKPPNCHVALTMDVDAFWDLQLAAFDSADQVSPLNAAKS